MADDIGELGLNTEDFESGITRASNKLSVFERVSVRVSQSLLGITGAGRLVGTAFARMAGSPLVMVAAVGALIKALYDARQEAKKLEVDIDGAFNKASHSPNFKSTAELKTELAEVDKLMLQLQARGEGASGFFKTLGQSLGDLFTGHLGDFLGAGQDKALVTAAGARNKIVEGLAKKQSNLNDIKKLELAGDEEGVDMLKEKLRFEEEIGSVTERAIRDQIKAEHDLNNSLIQQKFQKEKDKELAKENAEIAKIRQRTLEKELEWQYKLLTPREKFWKLNAQIANLNLQIGDSEGKKKAELESQLQTLQKIRLELLIQRNLKTPAERLQSDRDARKLQSAERKAKRQIDHEAREDARRAGIRLNGAHLDKRPSAIKDINNAFQVNNNAGVETRLDTIIWQLDKNLTNQP